MAYYKMPEVNTVLIAGNLTKDPTLRRTSGGIPVANFCIASNKKYRDANNHWSEEVCYIGVVAWAKLAESCMERLRKGSGVLVDGELQSRILAAEDGLTRSIVEIKAHRIQFLNRMEQISEDHLDGRQRMMAPECPPLAPVDEHIPHDVEAARQYKP